MISNNIFQCFYCLFISVFFHNDFFLLVFSCIGSLPVVLLWSAILIAIYSLTMTIFSNMLGMAIESGVSVFYSILLLLLIFPILPGLEIRAHFGRIFKLVLFPGNSISFTEVLLADALTSVSKVLKDIGVTLIAMYAHFNHSKIGENHNTGMIIIAVLASMPFWYVQLTHSTYIVYTVRA